jgi:hypothetical protein
MSQPETVICHYRVQDGKGGEFTELLRRHWPTLRELELATGTPSRCYIGVDQSGDGVLMIEIFEWADGAAAGRAHAHPAVSEIWERMATLCESRDGRPSMEFPHFRPLDVS